MVSLTNFRSVGDLADVQLAAGGQLQPSDTTTTTTTTTTALGHHNQAFQLELDAGQQLNGGAPTRTQTTTTSQLASNLNNGAHPASNKYYLNQISAPPTTIHDNDKQHNYHLGGGGGAPGAPKEHFEIRWNNLTYQVEPKWYQQKGSWLAAATGGSGGGGSSSTLSEAPPAKRRTNCILNNLNGSVKSGQVTAILGPSGAGKTSLLGCLTGKNKSGVSGSVQVIGTARREPMSICTIPQKDYLLNQLTVRENLWFASRLKHPVDGFDHDANIERVVELLKLDTCIDTKISKISGGQYKRVSIAQELLSNPDILILDEPTSGLDSLTCYKTVMVLRDLARLSPNPMAILVTIHQPQREVFDLFNHVYILAIGGRCIYEGHPSQSIKTINERGGGLHFDAEQYNPASYLVEIASAEFGEKPIEALVEHQRRDYKRRVTLQDQSLQGLYGPAGAHQLHNGNSGSAHHHHHHHHHQASLNSPMVGLKKRQSPMISRFKSTLSSLTGSGSSSSSSLAAARQYHPANSYNNDNNETPPAIGYTNQAYDGRTENENNIGAGGGGGVHQHQHPLQGHRHQLHEATPDYFQALDASQLQSKAGGGGGNNNNNFSNNNNGQPNNTINQNDLNNITRHQQQQQQAAMMAAAAAAAMVMDNDDPYQVKTIDGELLEEGEFYLDQRLQTHKHNHKGHFLRHCQLLTKRSWLCLRKDPMLTTLRFSAHIIVPLLITLVYGSRVGQPNACPLYESEMDLIDYARRGARRLLNLQTELRSTFENVGLYFLSIYAFTFSTMCLTSLSFPLNMHVLLKEVRNGWYSIPTYFIGKTLADFPLEFILPTLTLMITYPLTGQPSSYMEWRFFLATSIFVITSLIAQTQGLIFGALFMNAMQAAVFVAPVSTTPLILLSGFLIRISQMPAYLQQLSAFSYFRYAIESLTIIRYGFNQCPCDPNLVNGKPVSAKGVPDQLRTMTNYWLSTFDTPAGGGGGGPDDSDYSFNDTLVEAVATTTLAPNTALGLNDTSAGEPPVDFFQDLTTLLARANSFGADIRTCKDLKPYPMIDFSLEDSQLKVWVFALVATLILSKIANYLVVKYSVKWRL